MRLYVPIAKVDAEHRMVWGYASTEARDEQGEVVRRRALESALADYMKFANIREMHQLSAVGKAQEAAVDDRGLYVGARIVDPVAWDKVREGVYSGFSIGGKVTQRDPQDRSVITGIRLDEISLVDRPANPEAVFDCWKRSVEAVAVAQIWDCGTPGHRHGVKAEALRCAETLLTKAGMPADPDGDYGDVDYADPGFQPDKRPRYPIDTEAHIRAAWAYIHQPHNADRYSAPELAHIKARIAAAWNAKIGRDGPPSSGTALRADGNNAAAERIAIMGTRHSIADQAHLDLAAHCVAAAMAMPSVSTADLVHLAECHKALLDADAADLRAPRDDLVGPDGVLHPAMATQHATVDTGGNPAKTARKTAAVLADIAKADRSHQLLLDVAHHSLRAMTDGAVCRGDGSKPQRHSAETMAHLHKAHFHLGRCGATCEAATPFTMSSGEDEHQGAKEAAAIARLEKRLADETAEKAALLKAFGELAPRLEQLQARVEQIAQQPLPALTIARDARGLIGVSKAQDAGAETVSQEQLAKALANMSPEERTLTLIKAAHQNPISPFAIARHQAAASG